MLIGGYIGRLSWQLLQAIPPRDDLLIVGDQFVKITPWCWGHVKVSFFENEVFPANDCHLRSTMRLLVSYNLIQICRPCVVRYIVPYVPPVTTHGALGLRFAASGPMQRRNRRDTCWSRRLQVALFSILVWPRCFLFAFSNQLVLSSIPSKP